MTDTDTIDPVAVAYDAWKAGRSIEAARALTAAAVAAGHAYTCPVDRWVEERLAKPQKGKGK